MYIIRSDAGQPLREELAKSPEKIIASAFPDFIAKSDASAGQESLSRPSTSTNDEGLGTPQAEASIPSASTDMAPRDAYFQGLALVKTLVKLMPNWLQNNRVIFDTLVQMWKSPARISRLQNEQELNLVQASILHFWQTSIFIVHYLVFPGQLFVSEVLVPHEIFISPIAL